MMQKFCVLMLLAILGVNAWHVKIMDHEKRLNVGSNPEINCHVVLDGDEVGEVIPQFTWYKGDVLVPEAKLYSKGKTNKDLLSNSLYLANATYDDDGNYTCFATVGSEIKIAKAALEFQKAAAFVEAPQKQHAITGTQSLIKCTVEGDYVSVDWLKEGNEISDFLKYTPKDNGLLIAKFSTADSGIYTCRWRQSGKMDMLNISLTEYIMPTVEQHKSIVKANNNSEAKLTCFFSGSPTPEVYWAKMNKQGEFLPISSFSVDGNHTLVLSNVTEQDVGTYKCEARSLFHNVSRDVELTILLLPHVDSIKHEQFVKGSHGVLSCSFKGEDVTIGKWIHNDKVLTMKKDFPSTKGIQTWNLTVPFVTLNDQGSYRCEIENNAGFSSNSVDVYVEGAPVIINSTESFFIWPPTNIELGCLAESVPDATWQWYFTQGTTNSNLSGSSRAEIISSENGGSKLRIPFFNTHDLGNYTCVAENKYGTANKTIVLAKQVPPPTPSLQCEKNNTITSLHCVDHEKTASVAEKYIVYYMEDKDESDACCSNDSSLADCSADYKNISNSFGGHLWLDEMKPGTKYVLQVVAENKAGQSPKSACFAVVTDDSGMSPWAIVGYVLLGLLVLLMLIGLLWCLYRMFCRRSEPPKKDVEIRAEQNPFVVEETETEVVYESNNSNNALYYVNV